MLHPQCITYRPLITSSPVDAIFPRDGANVIRVFLSGSRKHTWQKLFFDRETLEGRFLSVSYLRMNVVRVWVTS